MAKIGKHLEPSFMNQLPFSVRSAARELYRFVSLRQLLEIRQHKVPAGLVQKYSLTPEQWRLVGDAVILTRLSQFSLSNHLSPDCVKRLKQIVISVLDKSQSSVDEIVLELEANDACTMAKWVQNLYRLKHR